MATESFRRRSALLDWQNEKKFRETIINSPNASPQVKAQAKARIKEADAMIKKLKK